jgi:hypothetical protein
LFTIFYGFTETTVLAPNSLLWILFVSSYITVMPQHKKEASIARTSTTLMVATTGVR